METTTENILDVTVLEPRLKHATIFDRLADLGPGEHLTIHNDHDPAPLRYQLQSQYGDSFGWEYLEEGPAVWRVRISRPGSVESAADETVLDVTKLAPATKHSTIFACVDALKEGQALVIHNDHDPVPLRYQLNNMYGDAFSWEYLEPGPTWWKVRIGRKKGAPNDVLDVTKLAPQVKHSTIFARIDALQPGEAMTLLNDHDPKPLYYQLKSTRGEAGFTWDYLEQGPDRWKVRIGIPQANQPQMKQTTSAADGGDNILDVTKIDHQHKHARIFERYHALQEGESLTIHNDHDPKPLYYQMTAEWGNVFVWEYLEEGPEWWKVKITKRVLDRGSSETLGEMVTKDLRAAEVFKKYNLDFCCQGNRTVREACAQKGIDASQVEADLRELAKTSDEGSLPYNDWNLDFLTDFVVNTHHAYARKHLPDIKRYAAKVAQVHGGHHPELHRVNELVLSVDHEMNEHMVDEESTMFPYIKQLMAAKNASQPLPETSFGHFKDKLDALIQEHETVGRMLHEMREITGEYALPEDACASYSLLFQMLAQLEDDLFTHIHLENNILFPKAAEVERTFA